MDKKPANEVEAYRLSMLARMVTVEEKCKTLDRQSHNWRSDLAQLRGRIDVLIYTAAGGLGTIVILLIGIIIA